MPKNDLFFSIFRPPLFSGRRPDFFGISLKFLHRKKFSGRVPPKTAYLKIPSFLKSDATLRVASHFKNEGIYRSIEIGGAKPDFFFLWKKLVKCRKNRASGPKIRGVQKSKKRSFFGIKNVKNFESDIQFFFLKKISTGNFCFFFFFF